MRPTSRARFGALALSVALVVGAAPAAVADEVEPDPAPIATLTLTQPEVLTLPDGDGIRDTTAIQLSADLPTVVSLALVAADGTTVIRGLDPITLTSDALSNTVPLAVSGFEAGTVLLQATPAGGASVSVPVIVGSGQPSAASVTLAPKTIYTWSKSTVRTSVATVTATDETGLPVPFSGVVVTTAGKTTRSAAVVSATGGAVTTSISSSGLPVGTAAVIAKVSGNGGPVVTSATASLAVKTVALTSTKVAGSYTTIYPTKDGYRDTTKLTISNKTTTGSAIPVSGTVKITRSGKTVKTWKVSSRTSWSASWDGKVGGRLVPGTYTVTVSIKGPQGDTKKSTTKIAVKKGKLLTKTTKKTHKASSVLKKYDDFGYFYYNDCWHSVFKTGDIYCDGNDSFDGTLSLLAYGTATVPSAVVAAEKYGGAKVRMTAKVSHLYGDAAWGYWPAGKDDGITRQLTKTGNSSPGWLGLSTSTKKIDVLLGLGEYSFAGIDTFTIEYSYRVLTTKY